MLHGAARFIYVTVGLLFVGLGILGAVLPVLPTTVFFIGALWAFSMSSPRLEAWLLTHPQFGPRLVAWRAHRVIPVGVKLTAWGSMLVSLTLMLVTRAPPWAIATAAGIMLIGAIYIATCPSRVADEASASSPPPPPPPLDDDPARP